MNKAELEKKHLSELHLLAAEAGVEKYRMLTKGELIERLAGENGSPSAAAPSTERGADEEREERPRRRRRRRTGSPAVSDQIEKGEEPEERKEEPRERRDRPEKAPEREPAPEPVVLRTSNDQLRRLTSAT